VAVEPMLGLVKKNWAEFLQTPVPEVEVNDMRKHERTGRPLCDPSFFEHFESFLNRPLKQKKPGRKYKNVK
jgi:putative transposase